MHDDYHFTKIIPVSALANEQLDTLLEAIVSVLPESEPFYPAEQVTDRSASFIASEILREKLTRFLGEELPYALTVTIELLKDEEKIIRIAALIWVERASQKAIVIGKDGAALKKIAQSAREAMEIYFDKKVFLQVWVKVKSGWSDDKKTLAEFGYD
jgi:GTP-binding protein Era